MSRYSMSNEAEILNRLDQMNDNMYRGNIHKDDLVYSMKTIRNLLLEIYLIRQQLGDEAMAGLHTSMENILANSEIAELKLASFEANKPI